MTDAALAWSNEVFGADLGFAGGDLATDDGLRTLVIFCLFTDGLAAADDVLPDGGTDRRGCWMFDIQLPSEPTGRARRDGSRLWLLRREKQTLETLRRAKEYGEEALERLIEDGIAGSVTVTCSYPALGMMNFNVVIDQQGSLRVFDFVWSMS